MQEQRNLKKGGWCIGKGNLLLPQLGNYLNTLVVVSSSLHGLAKRGIGKQKQISKNTKKKNWLQQKQKQ